MEKVVDTIGGIMIDVPGIVKDDQYPTEDSGFTRIHFTPGLQLMDGVTAVRYARTRHDGGDFRADAAAAGAARDSRAGDGDRPHHEPAGHHLGTW